MEFIVARALAMSGRRLFAVSDDLCCQGASGTRRTTVAVRRSLPSDVNGDRLAHAHAASGKSWRQLHGRTRLRARCKGIHAAAAQLRDAEAA